MSKRPLADWLAVAGLFLTLLTGSFILYGRFTALETRMDSADQDRSDIIQRLTRIEEAIDRLEARP